MWYINNVNRNSSYPVYKTHSIDCVSQMSAGFWLRQDFNSLHHLCGEKWLQLYFIFPKKSSFKGSILLCITHQGDVRWQLRHPISLTTHLSVHNRIQANSIAKHQNTGLLILSAHRHGQYCGKCVHVMSSSWTAIYLLLARWPSSQCYMAKRQAISPTTYPVNNWVCFSKVFIFYCCSVAQWLFLVQDFSNSIAIALSHRNVKLFSIKLLEYNAFMGILMVWGFNTRAWVATVLSMQPCICSCSWVKGFIYQLVQIENISLVTSLISISNWYPVP